MNYLRAILSGIIVWICVVLTFYFLEHTPIIQQSLNAQNLIIAILIILYAWIGAFFYYKNGNKTFGLSIGIMMSLTAILLDSLLFVPLVEIPKGNTYQDFFSNPLLYTLAILNVLTVYFYWRLKVR